MAFLLWAESSLAKGIQILVATFVQRNLFFMSKLQSCYQESIHTRFGLLLTIPIQHAQSD